MPLDETLYLELLPLDFVKKAAKVQHTQEDDLLQSYIVAAVQTAEKFCNTDFVRKTHTQTLDGVMDMPSSYRLKGRAIEILSVKRISGAVETVLNAESYTFIVGLSGIGGTLSFPFYTTSRDGGYQYVVEYESGYEDPTQIQDLKVALSQLVTYWYKNRESVVNGTITASMPLSTTLVLNQYVDYSY